MSNLSLDFDMTATTSLLKRMDRVDKQHVNYGWLTKSLHDVHGWEKKIPTAQIVFWNEFGTKNIPARPYLTITAILAQLSAVPCIIKYFKDNIFGSVYSNDALYDLDSTIKSDFKATVGSGRPLSPNTVKKKGNSQHWVEEGQLMEEFEVKVVNRKLT